MFTLRANTYNTLKVFAIGRIYVIPAARFTTRTPSTFGSWLLNLPNLAIVCTPRCILLVERYTRLNLLVLPVKDVMSERFKEKPRRSNTCELQLAFMVR